VKLEKKSLLRLLRLPMPVCKVALPNKPYATATDAFRTTNSQRMDRDLMASQRPAAAPTAQLVFDSAQCYRSQVKMSLPGYNTIE
jgi:hypothetical protein